MQSQHSHRPGLHITLRSPILIPAVSGSDAADGDRVQWLLCRGLLLCPNLRAPCCPTSKQGPTPRSQTQHETILCSTLWVIVAVCFV
eukprot:1254121-Rhodomonas_salina.2